MQLNKLVHKVLSPVLYALGFYQRSWRNKSKEKACVAVICYHRIVASKNVNKGLLSDEIGIPAEVFEKQMRFMLKHFTPIKPSEVLSALKTPGLYFAVTFDDGFEDNYTVAAPILSKLGMEGGFYVVSDFVDTDKLFWWEQLAYLLRHTEHSTLDVNKVHKAWVEKEVLEPLISFEDDTKKNDAQAALSAALRHSSPSDIPEIMSSLSEQLNVELQLSGREHPLMSWQQINDLKNRGFDIGGHTATHVNLGEAQASDYQAEIFDAKSNLEKELGQVAPTFAYPYGSFAHYTEEASQAVKEAGYQCAFTTNHGIVTEESDVFELPRFMLNKGWGFACAYNVANAFKGN